jgi:hypothetical protein
VVVGVGIVAASTVFFGCGKNSNNTSDGSSSDVATATVSGALNNTSGGGVAYNNLPSMKGSESRLAMLLEEINPLRSAYAMSFSCSGGGIAPAYVGPGTYQYTPMSCTITWGNGRTASSTWNSTFQLVYGATCDATHAAPWNQTGSGCTITRTTNSSGNTRTLTGPMGNSLAITHNTNGTGTGYDSSVSPAPNDNGVVLTCGTGGCASSSGSHTLVINGSHISGTIDSIPLFDHTVTGNLSVQGSGTGRTVNGSVTVQHNFAKFTATATFNSVVYGEAGCCFPTSGSVETTVKGGGSETLTFSNVCGEATLTQPNGTSSAYELQHCL